MFHRSKRFNGSLLTASGRTLYYRTASDGNPTLKVYDENLEYVLQVCIENEETPERAVNRILMELQETM